MQSEICITFEHCQKITGAKKTSVLIYKLHIKGVKIRSPRLIVGDGGQT